jgi:hypothetical protein
LIYLIVDRFLDLVVLGSVYYNHLENGVSSFSKEDSSQTNFSLDEGGSPSDTSGVLQIVQDLITQSFLANSMVCIKYISITFLTNSHESQIDVVTRWVAPYSGTIDVSIPVIPIAYDTNEVNVLLIVHSLVSLLHPHKVCGLLFK